MMTRQLVRSLMVTLLLLPTVSLPSTAGPREEVVHAAGKGNPWINLRDGHVVPAVWSGPSELTSALHGNAASPKALASADFDEDGVPDLIASYGLPAGGGLVTLSRGNVDAIYPNAPEAKKRKSEGTYTPEPFLPDVSVFATPAVPDFVGAGDFDADGHWDVVTARLGGKELQFLRGDGKGILLAAETIDLPGTVTALTIGEINRRDGLDDIVVGVDTPDGPRALVFEWPGGALEHGPESLALGAPATSLLLGRLSDEGFSDLVVGSKVGLERFTGRDRKLVLAESLRPAVQAPIVSLMRTSFGVRAMARGDFDNDGASDLAMLGDDAMIHLMSGIQKRPFEPAGLSSVEVPGATTSLDATLLKMKTFHGPGDDLCLLDRTGRKISLLRGPTLGLANPATPQWLHLDVDGAPLAALTGRLNSDALPDLIMLTSGRPTPAVVETAPLDTFVVTNTANNGPGSLRQAVLDSESVFHLGPDSIHFNIPGPGPHTISLTTELPFMHQPVTLDGTTQPGYAGSPSIEIDCSLLSPVQLWLSGGNSVFRGMAINRGCDLFVEYDGIVEGSHFGTDPSGNISYADNTTLHASGPGVTIGGTVVAARNIISSSGYPFEPPFPSSHLNILSVSDVVVQGNFIGTNATGGEILSHDMGGIGLNVTDDILIGGTAPGAGNVISHLFGFDVWTGDSQGLLIQGNIIGLDESGTKYLYNSDIDAGVRLGPGSTATVGGATPAARNVIAGQTIGVLLEDSTDAFLIGNYVGTDITGESIIGNNVGVELRSSQYNVIGGSLPGAGNLITSYMGFGIFMPPPSPGTDPPSTFNFVIGNLVGTDHDGQRTLLLPIFGPPTGIQLTGASDNTIVRNLIGGNDNGITLFQTSRTLISDNMIGTTLDGAGSIPNEKGIFLSLAPGNTVSQNLIGGNAFGIHSFGSPGANVTGNILGTTLDGTGSIANGTGMWFHYSDGNHVTDNVIAGSTMGGLDLMISHDNIVKGNKIGTNAAGTTTRHDQGFGIWINGSNGNRIGGTAPNERNVVSGHVLDGIHLLNGSTDTFIVNNRIGTDVTGEVALGNAVGIVIEEGINTLVGGTGSAEANVISGNGTGVEIQSASSGNLVAGNFIGTDSAMMWNVANTSEGIRVEGSGNVVERNVVAYNGGPGVLLGDDPAASGNRVEGNWIGTDPTGVLSLGNVGAGVWIDGASANFIGGSGAGQGNKIAFNGSGGVVAMAGDRNQIRGNSIYLNSSLGIDLGADLITLNDAGDTDAGANALQNFPTVTDAATDGLMLYIDAHLQSALNASFQIDVYGNASCDPSGFGEGQSFKGFSSVTTGFSGSGSRSFALVPSAGPVSFVTLTATDAAGNTSEFSPCVAVRSVPLEVTDLDWSPVSTHQLDWSVVQGAAAYKLYEGNISLASGLLTPANDSCDRMVTPANTSGKTLFGSPGPGNIYYYLVTAIDQNSVEGFAGEASAGLRDVNSPGACGASCSHSKCVAGGPIDPACDSCVAQVCDAFPSCCGPNGWETNCVGKVLPVCGNVSCSVPGQCAHDLCKAGTPLQQGCDQGFITPSCVDRICQQDPSCCSVGWSASCVQQVSTVCSLNCD